MKKSIVVLVFALFLSSTVEARRRQNNNWGTNPESERVEGYQRQDGTYVPSYNRTKANKTSDDNYSTYGNDNPWNGKKGYGKTEEEKTESSDWYKRR